METLHLTDRDRLDALNILHEVRMELTLMQRSVSDMRINGVASFLELGTTFQFAPLAGTDGFLLTALMAPAGHSATLLRGKQGAVAECISVPEAIRVEVQLGSLLLWQASNGPRERPSCHRLINVGDVIHLASHETHSYVCLEDCLTYNFITPAFGT